jgi:glycosyltransferase involved in cell wall biosynthesis
MRHLRDLGHEVTVIVYRVGKGVSVTEGVHLLHLPLYFVPKVFRAWAFDRKLPKVLARERFDFVLSLGRTSHQDAVLLPGNHLGYLRALGRAPRGLSDRMQIMMDRKAYAAPGTILACSEMMKAEAVELYGADPAKIQVLYPPTDTARFHLGLKARKAEFREKFGMREGYLSCVLVSASHSRKGLPLLLEVFAALKDLKFELLVAGEENVDTDLPNVRGLGFVRDTEALFAAADCTLLPAGYEPYGQVVSESVLCGTPVMVSPMVGASSVLGEGAGLVLPDFEVHTWVNALKELNPMDFRVEADWAERNRISLGAHVEAILACVNRR